MSDFDTMNPPGLDEWNQATARVSGVTTEQLDQLVRDYQAAYSRYEDKKAESSALYKDAEALEKELVAMMELAGKTKYVVEGVGTVYFSDKLTVTTPKTNADKAALFDYIRKKHGPDFFLKVAGINHQTLQSFYKSEFEEHVEKGDANVFKIPGLQEPTAIRTLNVRKEKAK